MSEMTTTDAPAGSDQTAAPVVPEGYVPAAEVETAREEARRQEQANRDLRAENERLKATPPAPANTGDSSGGEGSGSDLAAFRTSLLRDVSGVITMSQAASALKAEYPHADPGLFTPERLAEFASPDSLRFAAEDSHKRVAGILAGEKKGIEEKLRAEFEAKYGGSAGGEGAAAAVVAGGDPTPTQIAAMSIAELNAFEAAHPGVADRVLRNAELKEAGG